jgi:transposase-like protein
MVRACPECDQTQWRVNAGGARAPTPVATRYVCEACGHQFDDPVDRDAYHGSSVCGLAKTLADMDADDVGGRADE